MAKIKIEYISTAALVPYLGNSRTHSETQVNQIAESITEFGFTNPILIDEANQLIAGHGRLMAAQLLELLEVPCIRLSHLSERQRRAYIIADNKIALGSSWDFDKLSDELNYLISSEYDVDVLGFAENELDALLKGDKSILPEASLSAETIIVAEHERKLEGENKPRGFTWKVILEADNKSDAKKKLAALSELGYTGVILKDGE